MAPSLPPTVPIDWVGPDHDTSTPRHLARRLESQTQVLVRDDFGRNALAYTTLQNKTRTSSEGVALAVDIARSAPLLNAHGREIHRANHVSLTRNGSVRQDYPTVSYYASAPAVGSIDLATAEEPHASLYRPDKARFRLLSG